MIPSFHRIWQLRAASTTVRYRQVIDSIITACRLTSIVALGVAVLLSVDPDGSSISTVPAAIVGLAAAVAWLLPRRRVRLSIDDPSNDP
jgi:hypothetical protein